MSKRILAGILALMLLLLSGCNDTDDTESTSAESGTQEVNLWNTEDLREFGLKNAECPDGAIAKQWDYREQTHSIIAVVSNLGDIGDLMETLFKTAEKSSSGAVTDAYGKAISDYKDCLTQFDMYVFYYQANGHKVYVSVIYYEEGSTLLKYDPKTALITIRNVEYINY